MSRASVLAYLAFSTTVARAASEDPKIYAGAQCVAASGTASVATTYSSSGSRPGAIYNRSTSSTLAVICPVVRDNTSEDVKSAWVYVVDRSSYAVECELCFQSPTGSTESCASDSSTGSSATPQALSISGPGTPVSNGHLYFYCEIPPASGSNYSYLISYQVHEDDD